jgi:hypothetical protein
MTDIDFAFIIILGASCWLSYQYGGKKEGIGITLDYMREQGKIDFED